MDVVAPRAKENYPGKHGVSMRSDLSPKQVNFEEYDAVVIPREEDQTECAQTGIWSE